MPSQKSHTQGTKRPRSDLEEGGEVEQRWAKLVKPIRDFAESWRIDITKELDEYLDEIADTMVEDVALLDFRKAGILVQATSNIYGKKVESLAKFFQQFFTDVANQKEKRKTAREPTDGKDEDAELEWKAMDDIAVGSNLEMEEEDPAELALIQKALNLPQVPAVLLMKMDSRQGWMTRELFTRTGEAIGKTQDFMMNQGGIHSSGALLIDHLDELMMERQVNPGLVGGVHGFFEEPPLPDLAAPDDDDDDDEVDPLHHHHPDSVEGAVALTRAHDADADAVYFAADLSAAAAVPDEHKHVPAALPDAHHMDMDMAMNVDEGFLDHGADVPQAYGGPDSDDDDDDDDAGPPEPFADIKDDVPDPWAMELDPHVAGALKSKPLRKGKVRPIKPKKNADKGKATTASNAGGAGTSVRQFLKSINAQQETKRGLPQGPLKGLFWEEFGYAYSTEINRRKDRLRRFAAGHQANDQVPTQGEYNAFPAVNPALAPWQMQMHDQSDDEDDVVPAGVFLPNANANGNGDADQGDDGWNDDGVDLFQGPWIPDDSPAAGEDANRMLSNALSAGVLTGPLPSSYEDLCKKYVEDYLRKAQQFSEDRENGIARRVRSWEEKMKPLLETQELRGYCDIKQYGSRIVESLEKSTAKPGTVLSFGNVAGHQEYFEICRLFLATLHLANAGNVEIVGQAKLSANGNGGIGDIKLRLLSANIGDLE
ncbi:hypothetical protein M427DRAFT_151597 [Gonapodya prolifera JEL478]|uniref:Condensin-2 complex subunit H2 n=1 Tax=Gonapodya prolifera (strain JEL478) TaxID=1344416 RepID=A0A139AVV8_GONPJ|nr:hypothetical protein M427DRAFT_151597 [Gonapodya prolifera JEL478]|eukprot:KXS20866.1 hypothetical protein M427DRAFT_151597 [Gonapodya prolifera JEL478]